jgi:hypothetical protein
MPLGNRSFTNRAPISEHSPFTASTPEGAALKSTSSSMPDRVGTPTPPPATTRPTRSHTQRGNASIPLNSTGDRSAGANYLRVSSRRLNWRGPRPPARRRAGKTTRRRCLSDSIERTALVSNPDLTIGACLYSFGTPNNIRDFRSV